MTQYKGTNNKNNFRIASNKNGLSGLLSKLTAPSIFAIDVQLCADFHFVTRPILSIGDWLYVHIGI